MKDTFFVLFLWLAGLCLSVWLEVGCGWRAAGGGPIATSGLIWWLLSVSVRRELGWQALLLIPLTGLAWAWTGYPGAGALGLTLAAAIVPARLLGRAPWQPFAGSGFIAASGMLGALLVEAVSSGRIPPLQTGLFVTWLLSVIAGGLLGSVLLSADGLLGLARHKHLTSRFELDVPGYGQRVRGIREKT